MIITTKSGKSFDTEADLTAPERHILQKLLLWEPMVSSLEQFQLIKDKALKAGWNRSGPIVETPALKSIIQDLEEEISSRLDEASRKTQSHRRDKQ